MSEWINPQETGLFQSCQMKVWSGSDYYLALCGGNSVLSSMQCYQN